MRIALGIEYDGSDYCGFQYQDHSPSIQEKVEAAIARVANHDVRVICATHSREIAAIADHVFRLHEGRLQSAS